ncbi:GGDEF domain-containing protein [Vibrio sp. CDRSL-10 TSBA]
MKLAHEHLDVARQKGRSFTMYYMDLDGFKAVNDTYGHTIGDAVLKMVGQRLVGCLRSSDIVARLGGDEFVAILLDSEDHDFFKSQQIIASIGMPMKIGELQVSIGISIGAAVYPDNGATVDAMLLQADRALYQAKDQGRNRLVVAGAAS